MRFSVRTPKTRGSAANLIEDLSNYGGNRMIISSGYLTTLYHIPTNPIVFGVRDLDIVVGDTGDISKVTAITNECKRFASALRNESAESGFGIVTVKLFFVPQWHAKVSVKGWVGGSVSAAVIGSSNYSDRAMAHESEYFNIEADVLIDSSDGAEAQLELDVLLMQLDDVLKGMPHVIC